MTQDEAQSLVVKLSGNFNTYGKLDNLDDVVAYKRTLLKYDYKKMNSVIENLIDNDDRKDCGTLPATPYLVKKYKDQRSAVAEVTNSKHCDTCNDKGYILMTEYIKNGDNQLPYQVVYYCPFCAVGQAQAYNGNDSKEHKVNAVCFPITQILDEQAIEQMRYSNSHPHKMTDDEKETLRKKLHKIGLRMPIALDRGDAWEGDAPWET